MVIHRGRDPETGRLTSPISLEEWKQAIQGLPSVRLCMGDIRVENPRSGEVVTMKNLGGDAEYHSNALGGWQRAFQWSPSGQVHLNVGAFLNRKAQIDISIPQEIARRLGAKIYEEGDAVVEGDLV